MNYHGDLRSRRAQFFGTTHYSIANYCTDTHKSEMRDAFGEDLFHNLHLIPEPLKKNLADTLPTAQKGSAYESPQTPNMGAEYSRLSGIANFFSGMMSALSDAVFRRARSPDQVWQHANGEYENGLDPAGEANVAMSECKTAAVACEDKLNRVRQLLANKGSPNRYLARPRKKFVDPSLVEEHFEDAFAPEDFVGLANDTIIEYFSPFQYHDEQFSQVDAPKTNVRTAPDRQQSIAPEVVEKPESEEVGDRNPTLVVSSCEDKLSKLKALLQNKKSVRTKDVVPDTPAPDPDPPAPPVKPSKSIPIVQPKDKRFKNPHRLCVDKRQKARMKQDIQEDMLFANEIKFDESSLENSPSFHSLEATPLVSDAPGISKLPLGPQEYFVENTTTPDTPLMCADRISKQPLDTPQEYFDEISGRFRSTSASSEDSFQIVFSDIPQRVRSTSECDSEDSFIVFEESPNTCYTSNDVFGDSCSDYDSDSETECDTRMPQALTRTVSNLADDSLYDEVDCAKTVQDLKESAGLLLDERKKALKKNQPAKKVRFSEAAPRVLVMRVWAFAARQARPGHWERCARDRERFQRRIADVDMAVSWVLKPQHRARVLFQRFMPWWNKLRRQELADRLREEEARRNQLADDSQSDANEVSAGEVDTPVDGGQVGNGEVEDSQEVHKEVGNSGEVNGESGKNEVVTGAAINGDVGDSTQVGNNEVKKDVDHGEVDKRGEVNGGKLENNAEAESEFKSDNTQNGSCERSDADESTVPTPECVFIGDCSEVVCGKTKLVEKRRSDAETNVMCTSPKTVCDVAFI